MGFTMSYNLKKGLKEAQDETIKSCDKGRKAMQEFLVEAAKTINPLAVPFIWVLTRFYKRTITKESIKYNFYLLK